LRGAEVVHKPDVARLIESHFGTEKEIRLRRDAVRRRRARQPEDSSMVLTTPWSVGRVNAVVGDLEDASVICHLALPPKRRWCLSRSMHPSAPSFNRSENRRSRAMSSSHASAALHRSGQERR
jgi:hypothetical protein